MGSPPARDREPVHSVVKFMDRALVDDRPSGAIQSGHVLKYNRSETVPVECLKLCGSC